MISQAELISRIRGLQTGASIDAFEDWFREQSRNAHVRGDEDLNRMVDLIEGVFSEYHFANMSEDKVLQELALLSR
jgi:hypothetical protein